MYPFNGYQHFRGPTADFILGHPLFSPVRILFLAPDIDLSGYTGDVWHVRDMALALAGAGAEVLLVVANAATFDIPGGRVRSLRPRRLLPSLLLVWKWGRAFEPDVVYERRFSPKLSALLALLLRRPFLVEINGIPEEEAAMQGRPIPQGRLYALKSRLRALLFRRAAGVIAVTNGLKRDVIERFGVASERVFVVPNGVDPSLFRPIGRMEARRLLGLAPDGVYLCHVGNLVSWQGVDNLIAAMAHVTREIPNASLLIVGDGIERSRLQEQASRLTPRSAVRFVGRVAREEVPSWISACDVGVMPKTLRPNARTGSSALKLREYLACGVPVVATNIEGGGPFLESHGVGLGFEGDDVEDLGRKLLHLLREPELRSAMSARARPFAEKQLSWDRSARELLQVLGMRRETR